MRCDDTFAPMMTADRVDASFTLKKEEYVCNDSDSDSDSDNISSMPLPSLSRNHSVIVDESNNDFLRLSTMVRTVYWSYLHKCLLSNYATCCKQSDADTSSIQVKKYTDQMELHAVQLALEASLYRRNMLRMIADVKSHTVNKKVYKKLVIFLETPNDRIDIGIQTDDTSMDLEGTNVSPSQVNNFGESRNATKDSCDETDTHSVAKEESNEASQAFESRIDSNTIGNEDEHSQDSLLQHMEDMFCESDDSSDLTRLIEKHSGVTKANIDKEINKICLEADIIASSNLFGVPVGNSVSNVPAKANTSEGKISFSRYKEMQRRSIKSNSLNETLSTESKQKQKANAIWFVERVHQVSKLKTKMTELSLTNYRRYGRVKDKFLHLFGEFEEDEMMPDSPICIEEHLPACKERIAPWIVKYLMPFYKKRRIKNRQLFKAVAKYITDKLIIENTFPEQECVSKYIEGYFRNKKFIKTKQDIYL
ncbi:PREDICTED: uncharacterized protein LOC105562872 [Vollenhovia emeryi]|uniref:uncharacterized protein LOC105562872 n=1 Tax=Vollenhovia emeryi TaxID=411798 RepID=UPI0005F4AE59|nr:PREDICTED: uncharacterized protein LOC105562872 [Vollenhovia emeryi]XP_011869406.1 PREDICTED: uncharacterized protein LOC105562872 [Vollenhovia emeryi]